MRILSRNVVIAIVAMISLSACQQKVWHFAYQDVKKIDINDQSLGGDEEMDELLAVYRHEFNASMTEVLGTVEKEMTKSRRASALCNWFADAVQAQGEIETGRSIDIVVQNYGGIRLPSVAAGALTRAKVFELMPFENTMMLFEMKGDQVKPFLDRIAASGGWAINRGNSFTIVDKKATEIVIANKPFDPKATYTLGIPDFIANGGDGIETFKNAKATDTKILIRDLLLNHVKANPQVGYNPEYRIRKQGE